MEKIKEKENWIIMCDKCHDILDSKYADQLVKYIREDPNKKLIRKLKAKINKMHWHSTVNKVKLLKFLDELLIVNQRSKK